MFCKKCGNELRDSAKFCVKCGSPVDAKEADVDEIAAEFPFHAATPDPVQPEQDQIPQVQQYADPVDIFEKPVKKKKKTWLVVLIVALVVLIGAGVGGYLFFTARANAALYEEAQALLDAKDYDGAAAKLEELGGYEDAAEILAELNEQKEAYEEAQSLMADRDYEGAREAFEDLDDYADSEDMAAYGVDYQKALYIKECAAASDAAGYEVLSGGDTVNTEDPVAIAIGLYRGAAELFLTLGDYSDSAAQAMECYYSAGIQEVERENYDAALSYQEYMDEATAEKFYAEFLTYCADGTLLADMEAGLADRIALTESESYTYADLIEAELTYLEPYLDSYFVDTDLQAYYALYLSSLYTQLDAVDTEYDYIADEITWYTAAAMRMEIIDQLHESYGFLSDNGELSAELVGQSALYWSYAYIMELLNDQLVGVAPSVDGSGNYYLSLYNSTEYSFTLDYEIDCYSGSDNIYTSDLMTVTVGAGETVTLPLTFPADGDWDWYIFWNFYEIYLDGVMLDAA